MKRTLEGGIALIAWAGIVALFLSLTVGQPLARALRNAENFFFYFTVLSAVMTALAFTLRWAAGAKQHWTKSPLIGGLLAVSMALTATVYVLFLNAPDASLGALYRVASMTLHGVLPFLVCVYWGRYEIRNPIPLRFVFLWMLYPFLYFAMTLYRGYLTAWYPYLFLDVGRKGLPAVMAFSALVAFAVFALGLAFFLISRRLRKTKPDRQS